MGITRGDVSGIGLTAMVPRSCVRGFSLLRHGQCRRDDWLTGVEHVDEDGTRIQTMKTSGVNEARENLFCERVLARASLCQNRALGTNGTR
jgi:hypothetical protein